jgi:hypothetical protein
MASAGDAARFIARKITQLLNELHRACTTSRSGLRVPGTPLALNPPQDEASKRSLVKQPLRDRRHIMRNALFTVTLAGCALLQFALFATALVL